VEKNSMTKNRGGNDGSEKWIEKTLRLAFTVSLFWSLFFTWFFLGVLLFLFRQRQVRLYSSNWAVGQTTEKSGFDIRQDQNISLLPTAFKQFIVIVLGPTWFKRLTIREEDKSSNLTR
jgi:hypothetical protein